VYGQRVLYSDNARLSVRACGYAGVDKRGFARLERRVERPDCVAHGGDVGVMGGEFIAERGTCECCAICRRRKGSLGSVRDVFLLRPSSESDSKSGGGCSAESRNDESEMCAGSGQYEVRRDGVDVGTMTSSFNEFLRSFWRSVEAKLRAAGLRGGVVSPVAEGRTIVLVHPSHTPEV
jgi:hypothetical protein